MRSRYTAYTQRNFSYLRKTMSGNALKAYLVTKKEKEAKPIKWLGLVVHASKTLNKKGYVEFTATYYRDGMKLNQREHSIFKKINGSWYYVDKK